MSPETFPFFRKKLDPLQNFPSYPQKLRIFTIFTIDAIEINHLQASKYSPHPDHGAVNIRCCGKTTGYLPILPKKAANLKQVLRQTLPVNGNSMATAWQVLGNVCAILCRHRQGVLVDFAPPTVERGSSWPRSESLVPSQKL